MQQHHWCAVRLVVDIDIDIDVDVDETKRGIPVLALERSRMMKALVAVLHVDNQ